MKTYTLSECMLAINMALNYPSITFDDVSVYFDKAIAELNTTLNISLDPFTKAVKHSQSALSTLENLVLLDGIPLPDTRIPTNDAYNYYFDAERAKYVVAGKEFDDLYGVCVISGSPVYYKAFAAVGGATWIAYGDMADFDIHTMMPYDWVHLWLIPYVCFQYTVRDGGSADNFAQELTQGFQQLQNSYDVPHEVRLRDVAHLAAYSDYVKSPLTTR